MVNKLKDHKYYCECAAMHSNDECCPNCGKPTTKIQKDYAREYIEAGKRKDSK